MIDDAKMIMILDLLKRVTKLEKKIYNSKKEEKMTNLDKTCHKLVDSNHELKTKCALLEEENEELYEENKRLREILEYGKIDCKYLVPYEEGDYCMKINNWFFDFEGYEDCCPICEYRERR